MPDKAREKCPLSLVAESSAAGSSTLCKQPPDCSRSPSKPSRWFLCPLLVCCLLLSSSVSVDSLSVHLAVAIQEFCCDNLAVSNRCTAQYPIFGSARPCCISSANARVWRCLTVRGALARSPRTRRRPFAADVAKVRAVSCVVKKGFSS